MGSNSEQMHWPSLDGLHQHLLEEVEIGVANKFVESLEVLHQLPVLIRVAEGELHSLLLTLEGVLNRALQLAIISQG